MTSRGTRPATVAAPSAVTVLGVDLVARSLADADHTALRLAGALRDVGYWDLFVATHWIPSEDGSHAALSVSAGALDGARAWTDLLEALHQADAAVRAVVAGARGSGPPDAQAAALRVAGAHRRRSAGRLVYFPGCRDIAEHTTVSAALSGSAITRVRVLGGSDADRGSRLNTRGHLRPVWTDGQLELTVQPAAGHTLVPFESPNPTPCCADHTP